MGASKNDLIEDSFFNNHYANDGENACGSFETEEAIKRCYTARKPNKPPFIPFITLSDEEQESWDYMKLTNEEKEIKENEYLKQHGINF